MPWQASVKFNREEGSAVALHFRQHCGRAFSLAALGAPQPPYDIGPQRIPACESREGVGQRCARVAALACDGDDVLPEMISKADHGQWLARGHHPPIVATGR
jgi:hypothetical protein